MVEVVVEVTPSRLFSSLQAHTQVVFLPLPPSSVLPRPHAKAAVSLRPQRRSWRPSSLSSLAPLSLPFTHSLSNTLPHSPAPSPPLPSPPLLLSPLTTLSPPAAEPQQPEPRLCCKTAALVAHVY